MLIDVHSHADSELLKKYEKAGIKIIVNSTTPETIREVIKYKYAAFGLFPLELIKLSDKEFSETLKFIKYNSKKCVALGEVGLDYGSALLPSEADKMEKGFRKFLKLAEKIKKPIIVHARAASKQVFKALESFKGKVVLHYFMGSKKLIKKGIEKGYYFSFNPRLLTLDQMKSMAKKVPLNLMLLETDAPYVTSNPLDLKKVLKELAKIKGVSVDKAEKQIWENSKKLFNITQQ
jgi:TatD DNase family protein